MNTVGAYFSNVAFSTRYGAVTSFREGVGLAAERFEDRMAHQAGLGDGYYGDVIKYGQNKPKVKAEAALHPHLRAAYQAAGVTAGLCLGALGGVAGFAIGVVGSHFGNVFR